MQLSCAYRNPYCAKTEILWANLAESRVVDSLVPSVARLLAFPTLPGQMQVHVMYCKIISAGKWGVGYTAQGEWPKTGCLISLQGLYSLSRRASYHKISWSLEAATFSFRIFSRSEIWQAFRQQRYREAWQISERYDRYNTQSRVRSPTVNLSE